MKNFIEQNWFKIIILLIILVIIDLISYLLIFLPKVKQQVSFEQKLKCETLKNGIENNIKLYDYSVTSKKQCDMSWQGTSVCSDSLMAKTFEEIFYSPKLNTCLYLEADTTFFKGSDPSHDDSLKGLPLFSNGEEFYLNDKYYILYDALTGSKIKEELAQWRNTPRELLSSRAGIMADGYPFAVEEMLKEYK